MAGVEDKSRGSKSKEKKASAGKSLRAGSQTDGSRSKTKTKRPASAVIGGGQTSSARKAEQLSKGAAKKVKSVRGNTVEKSRGIKAPKGTSKKVSR
jgi:hypothetical protein